MPHGPQPRLKSPSSGSGPKEAKRLSCVSCRARKVKCDRLLPCVPCQRSGLTCVFPAPAPPRPRTAAKARSAEIQGRLSRLESLVGAMGGEKVVEERAKAEKARREGRGVLDAEEGEGETAEENLLREEVVRRAGKRGDDLLKEGGGRWMSGDFWSNLSSEVDGLKELLSDPNQIIDEEDEDEQDSGSSPSTSITDPNSAASPPSHFIFRGSDSPVVDLSSYYPYPPLIMNLFETYFQRFDPTFKILHKPSTFTLFANLSSENRPPAKSGHEALIFAMFYAAVTCMGPEETLKVFREDKMAVVRRFERGTETALTNADFLNSTKVVTLQAFIIYLACCRSHTESRQPWTLLALAVRIAYALDLHVDGELLSLPSFDVEIRRRLFWQLVLLDVQGSEDRGSTPIIQEHTFDTKMPSNINDEDLDQKAGLLRPEHKGCTEMTFSLVCHESSRALQILAASQPRRRTFVPVYTPSQEDRERRVNDVSQRLHSRFIVHCDPRVPLDWYCSMVAQIVILKFFLLTHYPVFTRKAPLSASAAAGSANMASITDTGPKPAGSKLGPPQRPRFSRPSQSSLLSTAISCLELQYRLENSGSAYAWLAKNFIQWHPLSVTLAILCGMDPTVPGGLGENQKLVDRAWNIVDTVFDEWAERVADKKSGQLWIPIRKLLERGRAVHGRRDPKRYRSTSSGVSSGSGASPDAHSADTAVSKAWSQTPSSTMGEAMASMQALGMDDYQRQQQQQPQHPPPQQFKVESHADTSLGVPFGVGAVEQQFYDQSIATALDAPFLNQAAGGMPGSQGLGMGSRGLGSGMGLGSSTQSQSQSPVSAPSQRITASPPSHGGLGQGSHLIPPHQQQQQSQPGIMSPADTSGMPVGGVIGPGMAGVSAAQGMGMGMGMGVGVGMDTQMDLGYTQDMDMMDAAGWQEWERFLDAGLEGAPVF